MTAERIPARQVRRGDLLWNKHRKFFFEVATITEHPVLIEFYGPRGEHPRGEAFHLRNTLVRVQRRGAS